MTKWRCWIRSPTSSRAMGYATLQLERSAAGAARAAQRRHCLLFTDISHAAHVGTELARHARASRPDLPILLYHRLFRPLSRRRSAQTATKYCCSASRCRARGNGGIAAIAAAGAKATRICRPRPDIIRRFSAFALFSGPLLARPDNLSCSHDNRRIDLGTTNSLCAVWQDGQAVMIPNALGHTLTPSVVGLSDAGEIPGRPAGARASARPSAADGCGIPNATWAPTGRWRSGAALSCRRAFRTGAEIAQRPMPNAIWASR